MELVEIFHSMASVKNKIAGAYPNLESIIISQVTDEICTRYSSLHEKPKTTNSVQACLS